MTRNFFRAGGLLGTGMVSSGVTSEMDAAFALLCDQVNSGDVYVKLSAILGLGMAYTGSYREDIGQILIPLIVGEEPINVCSIAALAGGFVFVGQCSDEISGSILEALMTRAMNEGELDSSVTLFLCLGLGLLYLGKGESAEAMLEALKVIEHPITQTASIVLESCAYTGTGNVLQIQKLLAVIGEHIEEESKARHQQVAVIGIAAIAMCEVIGSDMAMRTFECIRQYCEVPCRRVLPIALGLLSVSNPKIQVMETLSKLSHDSDEFVSQNAVLGLGLIGAGTNNSRIAQILRQLSVYYAKEQNHLFLVRIAQGLLRLGKGLLTLSPFFSDGFLMSKVSVCGLLALSYSFIDSKNVIFDSLNFMLYCITPAIIPRMLITLNENLEPLPISVRVGQGIDTVGQAGKPRNITGFQTHTTPVLLGFGERAELDSDDYIPCSSILEGFVILKKNPNPGMMMD